MAAVSILVPCYNVEKFLRPCMDSVVGQTLKDLEIICLNDGSTDSTLTILQEYAAKDSRIRIIDKPNSGYGDSMNRGLEAATGEYLGIVESDDIVEYEMFESMLYLAHKHDADMVKCAHYKYWSSPERRELCSVPVQFADRLVTTQAVGDLTQFRIAIWSGLYRRSMLEDQGIRFTITPGASYQDTAFNFKVWTSARTVYVTSKPWYLYRQDNANASMKSRGKIFAIVHEFRSIELFLTQRGTTEYWSRAKNKMKFRCYLWNFNRLDWAGRKRFLPVMRKEFGEMQEKCPVQWLSKKELGKLSLISNHASFYLYKSQFRDWIKDIIKRILEWAK